MVGCVGFKVLVKTDSLGHCLMLVLLDRVMEDVRRWANSSPNSACTEGVLTDFQETYGGNRGSGRGARGREVVVKIDTW